MKQEQIWGSLDDIWRERKPVSWQRRWLIRVLAVVSLLLLLGSGYKETGFSLRTSTLISEAVKECRDVRGALSEHSCAPAVWRACHVGFSADFGSSQSVEVADSNEYNWLCDAAQLAELAELAFVLASKYADRYYTKYENKEYSQLPPLLHEFFWLQDTIDIRGFYLGYALITWLPYEDPWFPSNTFMYIDQFENIFVSSNITQNTLSPLRTAIRRLVFSYDPESLSRYGLESSRYEKQYSLPKIYKTPKIELEHIGSLTAPETELLCYRARNSLREQLPSAETDADHCLVAAESCDEATTEGQYCQGAAYQAQIERLWQQLPAICAAAEDITTTRGADDSCRKAARRICALPYKTRNPDKGDPLSAGFIRSKACSLSRLTGY